MPRAERERAALRRLAEPSRPPHRRGRQPGDGEADERRPEPDQRRRGDAARSDASRARPLTTRVKEQARQHHVHREPHQRAIRVARQPADASRADARRHHGEDGEHPRRDFHPVVRHRRRHDTRKRLTQLIPVASGIPAWVRRSLSAVENVRRARDRLTQTGMSVPVDRVRNVSRASARNAATDIGCPDVPVAARNASPDRAIERQRRRPPTRVVLDRRPASQKD